MLNKKNEIKKFSSILTTIAMVFSIICFINIFLTKLNTRFDFTKSNIYTLTDYSKKLVSNLDDIVTIEYYITKKLPPHVVGLKQHITDLLNEYESYGKGNIQVIINTLASSKETHNKMAQLGIPRFQMNIIEQDKLQTVETYSAIALFYDNKTETIPVVLDINSLEYDLSLALKKITSKLIPEIGILTKNKKEFKKNNKKVIKSLKKQYKTSIYDKNETISSNIKTLVINNPTEISTNMLFLIDQFIMKGGNALFLIPTIEIDNNLNTITNKTKINSLINHYGITVNNELVLDQSLAYATFSEGYFNFSVPYPLWPKLIKQNFNTKHPILKKLESCVLPWSSSITIKTPLSDAITATILASTTKKSWSMKAPFNINPRQKFNPIDPKQQAMIVSLEGQFTSFYDNKPLALTKNFRRNSKPAKLIVIGNTNFITDQMITQFPNNNNLFLNIIDWLTLEDDLLGIPNRNNLDYPIKKTSPKLTSLIKWTTSVTIPIIIMLIGLLRYWLNKQKNPTKK